jgi:P pilus assembly chaperone PapD
MMIRFLLLFLLIASPAAAIDFTPTGTVMTVSYKEPDKNFDNTPLNDLARTNVYWSINGGVETKGPDVPSSSVTGGGQIVTQVTVPIAQNQSASVTIRATATDISGNESAKSTSVTKTVDRLPPMSPQ